MPFKVMFDIRSQLQVAVTTYNRQYAYLKYNEYFRKDPCTKLSRTVIPFNLTGAEAFLYLVYRVEEAKRNYFDHRDKVSKSEEKALRDESLELERQLDLRIADGRFYLQSHPNAQNDADRLSFFLTVEAWRKTWKEYFRYKRLNHKDPAIEKHLKDQCFDYERIIDKYIQKNIGL